jgi:FkbM family methyltransferase
MEWIDTKLLNYLDYNNGFFIEVGANDGITQSNTLLLEQTKNWKGILIEPSTNVFEKCVKNRPNSKCYNCALVAEESTIFIKGDFFGSLMSSVDGGRLNSKNLVYVKSRTLTSILDECNINKIDFFSLDVEGYELDILKGLDMNKYKPIYVLIEIYEKHKENIMQHMFSNDYELVCNLSDFNLDNNPYWDGTHNDYLFKIKNDL